MGTALRDVRLARGWTQEETAQRVGVSQGYWSFLESGRRRPSARLRRRLAELFDLAARPAESQLTALSLGELTAELAELGYPGFQHLRRGAVRKAPEVVLSQALAHPSLEPRLAEALPWLVFEYPDLDWTGLLDEAKRKDLQNRLGFVVTLGRQLAERRGNSVTAGKLATVERRVEFSKLVREDVFGRTGVTQAETTWLREHRPAAARQWNLLTNMTVENLHVS